MTRAFLRPPAATGIIAQVRAGASGDMDYYYLYIGLLSVAVVVWTLIALHDDPDNEEPRHRK